MSAPSWTSFSRFGRVDVSWIPKIATKNDLAVYLALCCRADKERRSAFPSKKRIATDAGISENEVRKALRSLEKIGALETRPRWNADGQTSSLYTLASRPADGRFAFVAAPWIPRIRTLNALRLFVALCSSASHTDRSVRGYSKADLAAIAGFHESSVSKSFRPLLEIGAVSIFLSRNGEKSEYEINLPPEAWLNPSDRTSTHRIENVRRLRDFVAGLRAAGTTFLFYAKDGKSWIRWTEHKRSAETKKTLDGFIGALPWCLIYATIGSDAAGESLRKAA